jgi:glycosyltransferase involved in cell wall biosynthesis
VLGTRPPARFGINAQKLSTSQSYHAAGSSRYVYSLLRELRAIEPPESIVAYLGDGEPPPDLAPTERFTPRRADWPTRRPSVRIAWEQIVLPRWLHNDRITVFHGAVNALPAFWGGPGVVTILDLTFMLLPEAFNRANRLYLRFMAAFAAARADRIIAISEATRRDVIARLRVPPERVQRIYCGVEPDFRPIEDGRDVAELRNKWSIRGGFILYLGTIEPRKNLVRLIDAYAELRRRKATDRDLVLAGGRGWGDETIVRRAHDVGVGEHVRFVGFVPEQEMPLWYNAADLFVYPSEYEGFGLPPLEALACGTPVIASNRSSLPEVVGEAGVLVDPTDTAAMADAMQRVLDDERLQSHLSQAGPEQARPFTWRRMAEETLGVYRAVGKLA